MSRMAASIRGRPSFPRPWSITAGNVIFSLFPRKSNRCVWPESFAGRLPRWVLPPAPRQARALSFIHCEIFRNRSWPSVPLCSTYSGLGVLGSEKQRERSELSEIPGLQPVEKLLRGRELAILS